jgi:hypothetical protein
MYPPSSKEADLEVNLIASLKEVPQSSMRRFARHSSRFMDCYRKGLTRKQAAWRARNIRAIE